MKITYTIFFSFLLSCCTKGNKINPVIMEKMHHSYSGDPLPQGICTIYYKDYEGGAWKDFQDSCHLYKVGDTLTAIRY